MKRHRMKRHRTILCIEAQEGWIGKVKAIRDANPGMSLKDAWVLAGRPGVKIERIPAEEGR